MISNCAIKTHVVGTRGTLSCKKNIHESELQVALPRKFIVPRSRFHHLSHHRRAPQPRAIVGIKDRILSVCRYYFSFTVGRRRIRCALVSFCRLLRSIDDDGRVPLNPTLLGVIRGQSSRCRQNPSPNQIRVGGDGGGVIGRCRSMEPCHREHRLVVHQDGDLQHVQEQMHVNQDLGVKAMEQVLKDKSLLTKQLEATGKAVAHLTLDREAENTFETFSQASQERCHHVPPRFHNPRGEHHHPCLIHDLHREHQEGHMSYHHPVPKLNLPEFNGRYSKIWQRQCEDFFHIYNVPEHLWITTATMHMEANAGRWVLKGTLVDWDQFMQCCRDEIWGL
jgi:hypothetical protein